MKKRKGKNGKSIDFVSNYPLFEYFMLKKNIGLVKEYIVVSKETCQTLEG